MRSLYWRTAAGAEGPDWQKADAPASTSDLKSGSSEARERFTKDVIDESRLTNPYCPSSSYRLIYDIDRPDRVRIGQLKIVDLICGKSSTTRMACRLIAAAFRSAAAINCRASSKAL